MDEYILTMLQTAGMTLEEIPAPFGERLTHLAQVEEEQEQKLF